MLTGVIWAVKLQYSIAKVQYIVYTITKITESVSSLVSAYFSAQIINIIINSVAKSESILPDQLIQYLIILAVLNSVFGIMNHVRSFVELDMNHKWHWKTGEMQIRRRAELDFKNLENPEFKILIQKVDDNMNWSIMYLSYKTADLFAYTITFVLTLGILFSLNPLLILIVAVPVVFTYFINNKYGRSMYAFWDDKGETKIQIYKAAEAMDGEDVLRESKVYGFSEYIIKSFGNAHKVFTNTQHTVLKNKAGWHSLVTIFNNAIYFFLQVWLVFQVFFQKFSIGNYTFYMTSLNSFQIQLFQMEYLINTIREQSRYAIDAKTFFEIKQDITQIDNAVIVENVAPSIEFKNVSFKYPNQKNYVLKNLTFKIEKGQRIALVGQNGAGKTTIIKLLARFYDLEEGEILVNGVNVKELDIKSYYKICGCLFQSFAKLWFSSRENIGIGNIEDIENLKLVKDAATKSGANEFIEKLKAGYETFLTTSLKGGTDLSGGQWQKIGIARSIFANPKFIVLDEPTSALDALDEIQVFKQIESLSNNATMLIVSHRFATVRQANRILVLENGAILEQGTHEELMANKAMYHEMFTAQALGYE